MVSRFIYSFPYLERVEHIFVQQQLEYYFCYCYVHFSPGILTFFILIYRHFLCIKEISPLSLVYFAASFIFPCCLFILCLCFLVIVAIAEIIFLDSTNWEGTIHELCRSMNPYKLYVYNYISGEKVHDIHEILKGVVYPQNVNRQCFITYPVSSADLMEICTLLE